ncbi:hypothetical protein J1614_011787 [Plenodomus biglobosus]|nr:hypothetical protein J1614_011787 [Plenodomus biglobosus]
MVPTVYTSSRFVSHTSHEQAQEEKAGRGPTNKDFFKLLMLGSRTSHNADNSRMLQWHTHCQFEMSPNPNLAQVQPEKVYAHAATPT